MYVGKLMCEILWDSCMYCLKKWHIVLGRGLLFGAPCRWAMALYHAILIARFQHPVHGARYKVCCVWSHLFVLVYLHFQYLNAIWLNMATRHVCFYLLCAMCLCMILLYKSINKNSCRDQATQCFLTFSLSWRKYVRRHSLSAVCVVPWRCNTTPPANNATTKWLVQQRCFFFLKALRDYRQTSM